MIELVVRRRVSNHQGIYFGRLFCDLLHATHKKSGFSWLRAKHFIASHRFTLFRNPPSADHYNPCRIQKVKQKLE